MARRKTFTSKGFQGGSALLIFALVLVFVLLGAFLNRLNSSNLATQRDQITSDALAQAKDALIGFAITYRDTHPDPLSGDPVFGYLPCPDTNNDGNAEGNCGQKNVSVIGRLPWKTLGLPPLRDGSNECLWYAVSGSAKNSVPKTDSMNWDTLGQFIVQDADGTVLAGANAHERPWAVIFSPRNPLGTQSPISAGATECGGSNTPSDYIETLDSHWGVPSYTGDITIKISNAASTANGSNNDRALWITGKDIFDRIKKRSDFKTDIDALVTDLANYLNNLAPASLPNASTGNKGIGNIASTGTVIKKYVDDNPSLNTKKANVLNNWQDNLLYAGGPTGSFTINGSSTVCRALLFFGGERTTRTIAPLTAQTRSTAAEKGDGSTFGDATMYLEGTNATSFPNNGAYTAATQYNIANTSPDIVRCINGLPAGSASFANPTDFASFVPTGVAVTTDTTTTPTTPTVSIADASGSSGGCFWFPTPIPLAGKSLRAYYEFKFFYADAYALLPTPIPLGSDPDRGNGFTLQMVRNDIGIPTTCGTETNMGALGSSDMWGSFSYIFETDVHRDSSRNDPAGNHTAIMTNGNFTHASGTMSSACNGSLSGCLHSPANKFEESPAPLTHNQRIEIDTGCNATCTICNPANPVAPNIYARIAAWVDCTDCTDVVADLNRATQTPTVQRCTVLDSPEMNSFYFGFTGGFRSGVTAGAAPAQGVRISNFSLRSD